MLNLGDKWCHQLCQATMSDNFDFVVVCHTWNLCTEPLNQTLHQADMPINDAGLHVFNCILAQCCTWGSHINAEETGSCTAEGFGRDHQSRGNCASQEVTFHRDHIKGSGRTEANNDVRPTIEMMSG